MPSSAKDRTEPVRRHLIRTPHGHLAYRDYGESKSPTVVLVHGVAAGGQQFEADAEHFASAGFRVLVPDLPGHGHSHFAAADPTSAFSKEAMADALLLMLDNAGSGDVHWVGNSLGGIVGLDILSRPKPPIRTFATFGTVYSMNLSRIVDRGFSLAYGAMGRSLLGTSTAFVTTKGAADRELIRSMIVGFDPKVGDAVARSVRAYDYRKAAAAFEGPILLIEGGKDRAVNLGIGATKGAMIRHQNFRHEHLPSGGHCLNLDAPHQFRSTVLDFWRTNPA